MLSIIPLMSVCFAIFAAQAPPGDDIQVWAVPSIHEEIRVCRFSPVLPPPLSSCLD
jgi:hypothetical protein